MHNSVMVVRKQQQKQNLKRITKNKDKEEF